MGLDMYMYRIKKNSAKFDTKGYPIDGEELKEIMYWRKAYKVRSYIMNNFINERTDMVSTTGFLTKENIEEIVEKIDKVLPPRQKEYNVNLIDNVFGNDKSFFSYADEYTIVQLKNTRKEFKKILRTIDFERFDILYSEWW